jgi:hypothetical protein
MQYGAESIDLPCGKLYSSAGELIPARIKNICNSLKFADF